MISLEEILEAKREEVRRRKRRGLRSPPVARQPGRFLEAVRSPGLSVIAEVKYASPSKGDFKVDLSPSQLACAYERGGAKAVSVLADEQFFKGGPEVVAEVRKATRLPLLYKDFVVDEWQILEAASLGADAVLLIATVLSQEQLQRFYQRALSLGMDPLVEVHDESDLERALSLKPKLVGVNNRNLRTMKVALSTFERLAPLVPRGVALVAESGMSSSEHALRMFEAGADAVLVGEAVATSPDPERKVAEFVSAAKGIPSSTRVMVKICGITRPEDAEVAVQAGADAVGLVFHPQSPRFVGMEQAQEIARVAAPFVTVVGVFVDAPLEEVKKVASEVPLQAVQLHGTESADYARKLSLPVIKAVRPRRPSDLEGVRSYPCEAILVDAYHPRRPGGTGLSFPWEWARNLARERRVIIAGGLHPGNVAEALSVVRPYGVDVSSGVEVSPGVKDPAKVRAFMEVVREWEEAQRSRC